MAHPSDAAGPRARAVPGAGPCATQTLTCGALETDGESLYWESTGAGSPVLLCHGLGGNHAVWFQQVPVLAERYRVVTWDQRGFGRSSDRAGASGPESAARDLAALLDHLAIARAHVIGQSMGGWAALGLALATPERVASLVLADTLAGISTPSIDAAFDTVLRRAASEPLPEARPLGRHPALGPGFAEREPARAFLYRELTSLGPPPPRAVPLRLRRCTRPAAELAGLDVPTLFVVGSEDDLFTPAMVREAAAQLRGARVVEIPGAGHSPYFETPEAWNREVLGFLAELPIP
jgi:pimeloyl-ACP methyl ester carboxylesterase